MLDAGTALAVMGNHEFNAIAWYMPDPELRRSIFAAAARRIATSIKAFLDGGSSTTLTCIEKLVDWFLTLPLWLDLPGLRVVHACWHPDYMAEIEPHLKPGRRLDPAPRRRSEPPRFDGVPHH